MIRFWLIDCGGGWLALPDDDTEVCQAKESEVTLREVDNHRVDQIHLFSLSDWLFDRIQLILIKLILTAKKMRLEGDSVSLFVEDLQEADLSIETINFKLNSQSCALI